MYADMLFRIALRYVRDSATAEDLVMQAFMKIFGKIASFEHREGPTLEAWMRKITVNEALMHLRKSNNFNLMESIDVITRLLTNDGSWMWTERIW